MRSSAAAAPGLMSVEDLQERLARQGPASAALRLCDVRWAPAGPSSRSKYDLGHIPGAVFVDLDTDLSRAQPRGPGGRHPLPSAADFAQALSRWGIAAGTQVVACDDGNGSIAARLWFLLKLHGHDAVALLDGGLAAWTGAGLQISQIEEAVRPAPLRELVRDAALVLDRPAIAALVAARTAPAGERPLLLDVRAAERYRGEVEPLDPVAGHIPGAVNAPFTASLRGAGDQRFRPAAELRALFAGLGAAPGREVIASCGSGVTACHALFALSLAGLGPGRLYAGSWSDWISDPAAEIARGSSRAAPIR